MEETPEISKSAAKKAAKNAGKPEKKKQIPVVGGKKDDGKEIIGITASKDTNFSAWYQELVVKGELVEYYNEVRRECDSEHIFQADNKYSTRSPASTSFDVR
jgi:prolyl-tRNA synthetase